MIQVHTRDGVFGPGGYGGGVFDGSNMGFGGLGSAESHYEQAAAGIQGLGTTLTWMGKDPDVVKFQLAVNKELSARGYKTIGTDGQLGPATCGAWSWLSDVSDLNIDANPDIEILSDDFGNDYTICKAYSGPVKVGTNVPWSPTQIQQTNTSPPYVWGASDPRVATLQNLINQQLNAMGYNPIMVTGVLDAATCGAMQFAKTQWGADFGPQFGANCKSFTAPTKTSAPPSTGPVGPTGPTTPIRPTEASMTGWVVGGLFVAAGIAAVFATKKRR